MSDLTVPQEGAQKSLPNTAFTDTSPHWPLLSPDERIAAESTATEHVLNTLFMAQIALEECLLELRLARTISDWRRLAERFSRVKSTFVPAQGVRTSREERRNACCARLILLGASREEATKISSWLIEHLAGLYYAGTLLPSVKRFQYHVDPKGDIREYWNISQEARSELENCWVSDGNLLISGSTHWFTNFGLLEANAFGNEPPTNPFCIATEEKVDRFKLPCPPASDSRIPDGFTHDAINFANEHVKSLLSQARQLLSLVSGQPISNGEQFDFAAVELDDLSTDLRTHWHSNALILPMRNASPENYTVAGIVKVTAHEALEELAKRVCLAFCNAISQTAFSNDSTERDRALFGPWYGHEVRGALPELRERNVELVEALAPSEFNRHIANLDREHALLWTLANDAPPPVHLTAEVNLPPNHSPSQEGTKTPSSNRGRKAINVKLTQRIRDAWDTGCYEDYSQLARELNMPLAEVKAAMDRSRKRRKKSIVKPS